jgi:hypothetical protein
LSEGETSSRDLFALADLTVLVIWNRGCPRCTEIVMGSPALADSAVELGAHVVAILFGPDDADALRELLWDESILVPHLWDADARVAADYGLGFLHLSVFVIDRSGSVRAVFDDQIPDLVTAVLPTLRASVAAPPIAGEVPGRPAGDPSPRSIPIQVEGRVKLLSTEKARAGDQGLFGETLEPGTLFLHRWDVRAALRLAPGLLLAPWLRVSNEPEEVLTDGAEQLSNAHGSLTLTADRGRLSAKLGAFPLRLAPLLLQRWDSEDVPPLGGVSSCGCGAGASGLSQRSLEVLGPTYTFEGASIAMTHRFGKVQGWVAIPDREKEVTTSDPISEWDQARYRRSIEGAAVDLGRTATLDPVHGLPSPLGLRGGILLQDDDRRTLSRDPTVVMPEERDERGLFALVRIAPWAALATDAEYVDWKLEGRGEKTTASGLRIGLHEETTVGRARLWGHLQYFRTDPGFDPFYMALSYDPNREGWRLAAGARLAPAPGVSTERLGLSVFHRPSRETEERDFPGQGRMRTRTSSVSLFARPLSDLLAELHAVETSTDNPPGTEPDPKSRGLSFDLRWEGSPRCDPMLRLDLIRRDDGSTDPHTLWQAYLLVRTLASL